MTRSAASSWTMYEILLDDTRHAFEDASQLQIGIRHLAHVDDSHSDQPRFVAVDPYCAIAHDIGTRVNAEDDLFRIHSFVHLLVVLMVSGRDRDWWSLRSPSSSSRRGLAISL